jgi:hypothetical protein
VIGVVAERDQVPLQFREVGPRISTTSCPSTANSAPPGLITAPVAGSQVTVPVTAL